MTLRNFGKNPPGSWPGSPRRPLRPSPPPRRPRPKSQCRVGFHKEAGLLKFGISFGGYPTLGIPSLPGPFVDFRSILPAPSPPWIPGQFAVLCERERTALGPRLGLWTLAEWGISPKWLCFKLTSKSKGMPTSRPLTANTGSGQKTKVMGCLATSCSPADQHGTHKPILIKKVSLQQRGLLHKQKLPPVLVPFHAQNWANPSLSSFDISGMSFVGFPENVGFPEQPTH